MKLRDPIRHATLATLRRTYERCFIFLCLAGFAALTEFAVVAYDGEPYRFIAAGAVVTIGAALGAAIAAPIVARFEVKGRARNRVSLRSFASAIALGAIACVPFALNRAVHVLPIGRR